MFFIERLSSTSVIENNPLLDFLSSISLAGDEKQKVKHVTNV